MPGWGPLKNREPLSVFLHTASHARFILKAAYLLATQKLQPKFHLSRQANTETKYS